MRVAPASAGWARIGTPASRATTASVDTPLTIGATRIAPPLLLGRLFRLFGADATIFPNAGGRFSYSPDTCAAIADGARAPWHALAPAMPVPAGGMSVERVPEMRAAFGDDAMLLIGGSLLVAADALEDRCRAFVAAVREGVGANRPRESVR